ncbi:MAG TPA: tetratricopeptide repeat protein, partial [bacterium]|nr:tetratricopeptide repeat protein [bacterium]
QSLRARCKSAYDDGFLMDVALQIDGAKGTDLDTFSNQISGWETQWQSYFNQRMGELEAGRISMQNLAAVFRGACHAERWSKAGLDPIKFFDNLNEDEKKTVYEAILLRYYFKNMIRLRWDEDQSDTTVFMKTKKGNCTVLNVMAQHMLRTTGSNLYRSLILPNHITLTLQTSQGQLYFETSGDLLFYPPGYYEKLTDHEFIRRNDQTEIEPWQTLGAVYSNAGYRAVLDRDWEKARVALEAALDIVPDSTNANHFMGKTLMQLGDREGAIRHFRRALDSSPGYTDSQRLLDELNAG